MLGAVLFTGTIQTNGGAGYPGFGGGGGGGIIALYYREGQIGGQVTSYGGGGVERGAAGVVYLEMTDLPHAYRKVGLMSGAVALVYRMNSGHNTFQDKISYI